jgi:hypothetical protein
VRGGLVRIVRAPEDKEDIAGKLRMTANELHYRLIH